MDWNRWAKSLLKRRGIRDEPPSRWATKINSLLTGLRSRRIPATIRPKNARAATWSEAFKQMETRASINHRNRVMAPWYKWAKNVLHNMNTRARSRG